MLFRMYNRWAERVGFSLEVQDVQAGDQAGITKATLVIRARTPTATSRRSAACTGWCGSVRSMPTSAGTRRLPPSTSSPRLPRRSPLRFLRARSGWMSTGRRARAVRALTRLTTAGAHHSTCPTAQGLVGRLPERTLADQKSRQCDERSQARFTRNASTSSAARWNASMAKRARSAGQPDPELRAPALSDGSRICARTEQRATPKACLDGDLIVSSMLAPRRASRGIATRTSRWRNRLRATEDRIQRSKLAVLGLASASDGELFGGFAF